VKLLVERITIVELEVQLSTREIADRSSLALPVVVPPYAEDMRPGSTSASTPAVSPGGSAERYW